MFQTNASCQIDPQYLEPQIK